MTDPAKTGFMADVIHYDDLIYHKAVAIGTEWAIHGKDHPITQLIEMIERAMRAEYARGRRRELGIGMMETLPE